MLSLMGNFCLGKELDILFEAQNLEWKMMLKVRSKFLLTSHLNALNFLRTFLYEEWQRNKLRSCQWHHTNNTSNTLAWQRSISYFIQSYRRFEPSNLTIQQRRFARMSLVHTTKKRESWWFINNIKIYFFLD